MKALTGKLEISPGKFGLSRTSTDLRRIESVEGLTFDQIPAFICAGGWSATIFQLRQHKKSKFYGHGLVLVLDFDQGLTVADAKRRFKSFRYIMGLTKSHQKTKNAGTGSEKPPCDRFRVLLFSERQAESVAELEATYRSMATWNPEADRSCLDASRVWHPCTKIVAKRSKGKLIPISEPSKVPDRGKGQINTTRAAAQKAPLKSTSPEDDESPRQPIDPARIHNAASGFLRSTRPSRSGEQGHNKLFRATAVLIHEFMLSDDDAEDLLWRVFNPRCTWADGSPYPWSKIEIRHKIRAARRKSADHVYGYGMNMPWDFRWRCCPALAALVEKLGRNEAIDRSRYAPEIEEHARAALDRKWIGSKTSKQRVDPWFSDLYHFLQGTPPPQLDADYLLRNCFGIQVPNRGQRTRLGRAMSAVGWKSKRVRGSQIYLAPVEAVSATSG